MAVRTPQGCFGHATPAGCAGYICLMADEPLADYAETRVFGVNEVLNCLAGKDVDAHRELAELLASDSKLSKLLYDLANDGWKVGIRSIVLVDRWHLQVGYSNMANPSMVQACVRQFAQDLERELLAAVAEPIKVA